MSKDKRLNLRIPAELYDKLEQTAAVNGMVLSAYVRSLLEHVPAMLPVESTSTPRPKTVAPKTESNPTWTAPDFSKQAQSRGLGKS